MIFFSNVIYVNFCLVLSSVREYDFDQHKFLSKRISFERGDESTNNMQMISRDNREDQTRQFLGVN